MRTASIVFAVLAAVPSAGAAPPTRPDLQPFAAHVRRLMQAAELAGEPFTRGEMERIDAALEGPEKGAITAIEDLLSARCLVQLTVSKGGGIRATPGPARRLLVQGGWRQFLIRVENPHGIRASLRIESPNSRPVFDGAHTTGAHVEHQSHTPQERQDERWLDIHEVVAPPLRPELSGLELEYRIVQLYSTSAGTREASLRFGVGGADEPAMDPLAVKFDAIAARSIALEIRDAGAPATGSLVIKDRQGRIYPSLAKRLAPDFGFHPQVYRSDGQSVSLPDGDYEITFRRGPESVPETRWMTISADTEKLVFEVRRWIDPSALKWWSGDHHIHASGCAHYSQPTQGVAASDVALHCRGEDLKIGAALTWGPGFDYQKQFFTGKEDSASVYPYLVRYDVEVSGFGSFKSGHLCLLRLKNQMYPGGTSIDHWPTLGMNTIRWAKEQGAIVGPAHSGWGLQPVAPDDETLSGPLRAAAARTVTEALPNYVVPPYNGVGANEYIVDVTHRVKGAMGRLEPAIDFISVGDTPYVWELNMWYHTLNAGFRTKAAGETDFPCIYGERVGMGRSYVKLASDLTYDDWCEGIKQGRSYVSDGKSHLMEFSVDGVGVGEHNEVALPGPSRVSVSVLAAALLAQTPTGVRELSLQSQPYWDLERARIGAGREVPLEVVVNGMPVAMETLLADGTRRELTFRIPLQRSSWIAVRIKGSSHTNPIFVIVGGQPIRASRRSLQWCLDGVDRCWSQKERFIAPEELAQARADYDHARRVYRDRLSECEVD